MLFKNTLVAYLNVKSGVNLEQLAHNNDKTALKPRKIKFDTNASS